MHDVAERFSKKKKKKKEETRDYSTHAKLNKRYLINTGSRSCPSNVSSNRNVLSPITDDLLYSPEKINFLIHVYQQQFV